VPAHSCAGLKAPRPRQQLPHPALCHPASTTVGYRGHDSETHIKATHCQIIGGSALDFRASHRAGNTSLPAPSASVQSQYEATRLYGQVIDPALVPVHNISTLATRIC
jgi:hypothetical protein